MNRAVVNTRTKKKSRRRSQRRGLSLMEVVLSTLLVGVVLVGALRRAGAVIVGRMQSGEDVRAALLAQELLAEIVVEPYEDEGGAPVFGREAGESDGDRKDFDDVDDYHGWSKSPPETHDGKEYTDLDGWQRDVTVEWVQAANPAATSAVEQGLKRITVAVSFNGQKKASAVSVRSNKYVEE